MRFFVTPAYEKINTASLQVGMHDTALHDARYQPMLALKLNIGYRPTRQYKN